MYYPSAIIEDKIQSLEFVDFIFEVLDANQVPSRVTVNSMSFLIGGVLNRKSNIDKGGTITIEESVANCAMEIIDSIEKDFTILNTYHR